MSYFILILRKVLFIVFTLGLFYSVIWDYPEVTFIFKFLTYCTGQMFLGESHKAICIESYKH